MSNYFQILSRLETKRAARASKASAGLPDLSQDDTGGALVDDAPMPFPDLPLAKRDIAFGVLLDNLRARATTTAVPCFTLAGVTAADTVHSVLAGLEAQAERRSLRLLLGQLVISQESRALTRYRDDDPASRFDCSGRPFAEALREWWDLLGAGHDLIVIAAPPLNDSVDTALLGKAGEGLVLVVHPYLTPRATLRKAAARAKTAGCPILGVVMNGTRGQLPRWLAQILEAIK